MSVSVVGFDWDKANLNKLAKHVVTQEEAEEIFYLNPFIDEGAYERKEEKRYRCLGVTSQGRHLAAFFTIRNQKIRNISVRPMRKKEKIIYEEKNK